MNLHRFDVKTIKNVELRLNAFKTTQNYKSDQITMTCIDWCQNILNYKSDQNTKTCIDFMSNRSKQLKTTKAIKLQWIASIWRHNDQKCWVTSQNIQNNAKLQKWSKYKDLHRFHVKTIKTTQNYKSDQITMNCIDLTS